MLTCILTHFTSTQPQLSLSTSPISLLIAYKYLNKVHPGTLMCLFCRLTVNGRAGFSVDAEYGTDSKQWVMIMKLLNVLTLTYLMIKCFFPKYKFALHKAKVAKAETKHLKIEVSKIFISFS